MASRFQAQIDESGRVTLPPELLRELHLEPGAFLAILKNNGKITLEPVTEEPVLIEKEGLLVLHAQLNEDLSDLVEKERQKRIAEFIKDAAR